MVSQTHLRLLIIVGLLCVATMFYATNRKSSVVGVRSATTSLTENNVHTKLGSSVTNQSSETSEDSTTEHVDRSQNSALKTVGSLPVGAQLQTAIRKSREDSSSIVYVESAGNFTSRIHALNELLHSVRESVIRAEQSDNESSRSKPISQPIEQVPITGDEYVFQLQRFAHIRTIALPWLQHTTDRHRPWSSLTDDSNTLVQSYYPWTGTDFCVWLARNRKLPRMYVDVFRRLRCAQNNSANVAPATIQFGHMKENGGDHRSYRYPADFNTAPPRLLTFIHLITGGVFVRDDHHIVAGNVMLFFDTCKKLRHVRAGHEHLRTIVPTYDELFTMRNRAGRAVFHGIAEEIPRIAPYVEFLRRNPQIKIHVSTGRRQVDFLRALGLDVSRIVTGSAVRCRMAYVPRPRTCMMPRLTDVQLLSSTLRAYIRSQFPARSPRNAVVFIKRTESRQFGSSKAVEGSLRETAARLGFRFVIFADNPLPSFNATMRLFHSAVVVVGGHGAGLSNILFCQPGTYVVEIVPDSFITPLCYLQLAHALGQRWHGIPSGVTTFSKIVVSRHVLNAVVRQYLERIKKDGL